MMPSCRTPSDPGTVGEETAVLGPEQPRAYKGAGAPPAQAQDPHRRIPGTVVGGHGGGGGPRCTPIA